MILDRDTAAHVAVSRRRELRVGDNETWRSSSDLGNDGTKGHDEFDGFVSAHQWDVACEDITCDPVCQWSSLLCMNHSACLLLAIACDSRTICPLQVQLVYASC